MPKHDPSIAYLFVSLSLGKSTEPIQQRGKRSDGSVFDPQARQRDLTFIAAIITPPEGNCTIIHRYSTTTYATQVVLLASLTYMFQRKDWREAIVGQNTGMRRRLNSHYLGGGCQPHQLQIRWRM